MCVLSEADVSSGDAFDGNPREQKHFFKTRQLMIERARVQRRARVGVVDKEEASQENDLVCGREEPRSR